MIEPFEFGGWNACDVAKHVRVPVYLRDVFETFEMDEGLIQIGANGETAMLAKQERIVIANKRADDFGVLIR
jgi:hypothetical protein